MNKWNEIAENKRKSSSNGKTSYAWVILLQTRIIWIYDRKIYLKKNIKFLLNLLLLIRLIYYYDGDVKSVQQNKKRNSCKPLVDSKNLIRHWKEWDYTTVLQDGMRLWTKTMSGLPLL